MLINSFALICSYLLGSIPSGLLIGQSFYHTDIRQYGSGNIGTTNAFRALGVKGGLFVFICDLLKGFLPVIFLRNLPGITWPLLAFGLAAIVGHSFSIFLAFKGGKAVATSFGVGLAIAPVLPLASIGVFFIVLYISRMVSLSSVLAMVFASCFVCIYPDGLLRAFIWTVSLLIIVRHRTNIQRILKGTESKVPFGLGYRKEQEKK